MDDLQLLENAAHGQNIHRDTQTERNTERTSAKIKRSPVIGDVVPSRQRAQQQISHIGRQEEEEEEGLNMCVCMRSEEPKRTRADLLSLSLCLSKLPLFKPRRVLAQGSPAHRARDGVTFFSHHATNRVARASAGAHDITVDQSRTARGNEFMFALLLLAHSSARSSPLIGRLFLTSVYIRTTYLEEGGATSVLIL